MHSYDIMRNQAKIKLIVLILVVMEDALVHARTEPVGCRFKS